MPYFAVDVRQTIYVEADTPQEAKAAVASDAPFLSWLGERVEVVSADRTACLAIRQLKRKPTALRY